MGDSMEMSPTFTNSNGRFRAGSFGLLGLTSLPVGLLLARVAYTRSLVYSHVVWNLALAWVPVGFAWLAVLRGRAPLWLRSLAALGWMLFLPNAPYLITDLVYLHPSGQIPLLYDGVLLFSLGLCGLALGLVSLGWMQEAVAARLGNRAGWVFAVGALAAAGFGVYLGRFLRWNSWDVVVRPAALAEELLLHVTHPLRHWRAWAMSGLFSLLLAFTYWPLASLAGKLRPVPR